MRFFLFFLVSLFIPAAAALKNTGYGKIDAMAGSVPDSIEFSVSLLSEYFSSRFPSETERVRAIFYWTATNIDYDVANMYRIDADPNPGVTILKTLESRKAVCEGYALLFREICLNAGIRSYLVHGYTKQNGELVNISHVWVVAVIDSNWYAFDPTWGGGYLMKRTYVKQFNNDYFMVRPEVIIKSHMPFDPMWQCLERPVTPVGFLKGTLDSDRASPLFAFPDSITRYETLETTEKEAAALRRIEEAGITNNMTYDYARYLQQRIESEMVYRQNQENAIAVDQYNSAVNHYNDAVKLFNRYIQYYNAQFKPALPDREIVQMVDTCDAELRKSRQLLITTVPIDAAMKKSMEQIAVSIGDLQKQVNEQKGFLNRWLTTSKASRPGLFRKYTIYGIPIN